MPIACVNDKSVFIERNSLPGLLDLNEKYIEVEVLPLSFDSKQETINFYSYQCGQYLDLYCKQVKNKIIYQKIDNIFIVFHVFSRGVGSG